jgi:LEA14-like dessication related protein
MQHPKPPQAATAAAPVAAAAFVATLALALAACSKPQPPTITSVKPTSVMVDARGVTIGLDVGMQNPNRVAIPVQSIDAHVTLDDTIDLGDVKVPEAVLLPAQQEAHVPVSVPLAWTDMTQMASLATSGRDVKYKAVGTVTLGGDLLNVSVPFDTTGTIKQQDLAQGAMKGLPKLLVK